MNTSPDLETITTNFRDFMDSFGTPRDRRNKLASIGWSILLMASMVSAALLLKTGIASTPALRALIVAVPIVLIVPWLLANLRFLRETDELVRKVHMEGMAIGFWTAFAVGVGYVILEGAGLPRIRPSMAVAILVAVMSFGYAIGRALASKRYR
jgi:uncharacterized protein YacL